MGSRVSFILRLFPPENFEIQREIERLFTETITRGTFTRNILCAKKLIYDTIESSSRENETSSQSIITRNIFLIAMLIFIYRYADTNLNLNLRE